MGGEEGGKAFYIKNAQLYKTPDVSQQNWNIRHPIRDHTKKKQYSVEIPTHFFFPVNVNVSLNDFRCWETNASDSGAWWQRRKENIPWNWEKDKTMFTPQSHNRQTTAIYNERQGALLCVFFPSLHRKCSCASRGRHKTEGKVCCSAAEKKTENAA